MTNPPDTNIHFRLAEKVCIITGGAQSIGQACAERFAREGARVVIADIDDVNGKALAQKLQATYVHCDVGEKAQVEMLVKEIITLHGRIDVLVNNAGISRAANFLDVAEADFDAVLRVNLKGSFLLGQAVEREMAKTGGAALST